MLFCFVLCHRFKPAVSARGQESLSKLFSHGTWEKTDFWAFCQKLRLCSLKSDKVRTLGRWWWMKRFSTGLSPGRQEVMSHTSQYLLFIFRFRWPINVTFECCLNSQEGWPADGHVTYFALWRCVSIRPSKYSVARGISTSKPDSSIGFSALPITSKCLHTMVLGNLQTYLITSFALHSPSLASENYMNVCHLECNKQPLCCVTEPGHHF